jgi:redox-sensitive bicupin YhaK (pirin superfamily)
MIPQSKGKIFLSEERGLNELDWFRSYNTFNFGRYYNEYKTPFGALYVLNEDTLAGGRSFTMQVEEDSCIILIPVVGAITYKDSSGNTGLLEAGQAQLLKVPKGGYFEITNPYGSDLVKFLQLWIKTPGINATPAAQSFSFDISGHKNRLIEIFSPAVGALQHSPDLPVGLIGMFAGREEATYQILNSNGLFAFVIEGAFEVQYRLLHAGDGLALWGLQEVELEALSNDAIILLVEVPVTA